MPSSPAFAQIGSRRGSSTGTRRSAASVSHSPRFLKILSPRAPASTSASSRAAASAPNSGSPMSLKSTFANTTKRPGYAASKASICRARLRAGAAAQVDADGEVERVHVAHELVELRPAASSR